MSPIQARRMPLLLAFLAGSALVGALAVVVRNPAWLRAPEPPRAAGDPVARERNEHLAMVEALRRGGYLIYMRHGHRDKWDSVIAFDVVEADAGEDAAQQSYRGAVCLSAQGREEAMMTGRVFRRVGVPVGQVVTSPICRARQTAQLAFGRFDSIHHALIHTPVVNARNAEAFKRELRQLLTTVPIRPGTNTFISGHENTIRNHPDLFASGREWFGAGMLQETGMHVIRRDADGSLHLVHRFANLGEMAAAGIMLDPKAPAKPGAAPGL